MATRSAFLRWYSRASERSPFSVAAVTGVTAAAGGDLFVQTQMEKKAMHELDWTRL